MQSESSKFDPYLEWLDITPAEQPADYYRLLNVPTFEEDTELIRSQADDRMAKVRKYQNSKHSRSCQRILNELSAAKSCLLSQKLRRIYDAKLAKILKANELPHLSQPGKLFPAGKIPDNFDPFHGTADQDTESDPLQPIVIRSFWPILIPILIAALVLLIIGFTLNFD